MRITERVALAALILLCLGAGALAEETRTSPTIARETAESNAKTPAGRRYESALESSLDAWLRKALEKCLKGVTKEDAVSFDFLVRIGDNGRAEEVLFSPETTVGRCAKEDFQDAKYPTPPQAHWWVKIPVQVR